MNVLLVSAGSDGCGYHRMTEPARAVLEADLGVDVIVRRNLDVTAQPTVSGGWVLTHVDSAGADVVVMQRPTSPKAGPIIENLQAQGVAVVVEVDDLLSAVPADHASFHSLVRGGEARRLAEFCRMADLVTVSTPALAAEYGRHGRVAVIPNAIPRRIAELPPAYEQSRDAVTVGWTGTVATHPQDLFAVGSGVQQALDASERARLVILGQAHGAHEALGVREEPEQVPWLDSVDEYLAAVGDRFDVGIAPLRLDRFNEAKSWLKPLEYAARGVFPIGSPTSEYRRLGVGRLAASPKDWARELRRAVLDDGWRTEQAALARQTVLERHLTEHTAERWADAWRTAADNRGRRVAA